MSSSLDMLIIFQIFYALKNHFLGFWDANDTAGQGLLMFYKMS